MFHRLPRLSALLLLATLSAGCPLPLFSIEVETASVCVTVDEIRFEGVPMDGVVALEHSVDASEHLASIRETMADVGVTSSITLQSVSVGILPSPDAPASFSFVDSFHIAASTLADDSESDVWLACQDCGSDASSLELALEPVNMTDYLEAESLTLDVAIAGDMPSEAWSMSMDLCFSTTVKYEQSL